MKMILTGLILLSSVSAHAGAVENLLAFALSSPKLDVTLKELNETRVAKDLRGWARFDFSSATIGGNSSSASSCESDLDVVCNSESTQEFTLVYENHYGIAQKATLSVKVHQEKKDRKDLPMQVTAEIVSVENTDGPIFK